MDRTHRKQLLNSLRHTGLELDMLLSELREPSSASTHTAAALTNLIQRLEEARAFLMEHYLPSTDDEPGVRHARPPGEGATP